VVVKGDRIGVLDIKTGSPRPEHHEQVRNYMRHIAQAGPGEVHGALLYLRDGRIEVVRP
jgi:GTP cyclohydrolase II